VRAKFAVSLLLLSSLPAAAVTQPAGHDGQWRVEVQTTVGNCPRAGEVVVTIKNNRVGGIDAQGVTPWGYIDDTNTFVGRFTIGEKIIRANGDVKGQTAAGPWSSNTDYCGGRWSARKID
jgi:hypothetical protein